MRRDQEWILVTRRKRSVGNTQTVITPPPPTVAKAFHSLHPTSSYAQAVKNPSPLHYIPPKPQLHQSRGRWVKHLRKSLSPFSLPLTVTPRSATHRHHTSRSDEVGAFVVHALAMLSPNGATRANVLIVGATVIVPVSVKTLKAENANSHPYTNQQIVAADDLERNPSSMQLRLHSYPTPKAQ